MPSRPAAPSLLGEVVEVEVGAVAHGGHCVARLGDQPSGRVIFVRHAVPGERVRVRITEDGGGSFVRGDAIEVLRRADDRVDAPCPHAGPGRCGGCDWQHVSAVGQRALKAYVVREQFARLAGLDVDVDVRELPGGLLHWRTRIGYTPDQTGRVGLRRHRSRDVEPIESCPLGVPGVGDGAAFEQSWPGRARVEVASDDEGEICVLTEPTRPAADRRRAAVPELVHGPPRLHHTVRVADAAAIRFVVAPSSFWQVHPAAAQTFVSDVLGYLAPRAGDVVLDLYAGAGLFSAAFAQAVGPSGRVVGIETSAAAVEHAAVNLNDFSWAEVRRGHIGAGLIGGLELAPDLIVLDPPRAGLGADAMTAVLGLGARAIAYVACDPASLARDVRVATERGWHLRELSAYDAFPMTHHVECIAVLTPN